MGGKGGFTFLLVQTFLVNTIPAVFLDKNSQAKDINDPSKTPFIQQNTIMKSIINLNENLEVYIESGTARIRFKDEGSFKPLPEEKPAEESFSAIGQVSSHNPRLHCSAAKRNG